MDMNTFYPPTKIHCPQAIQILIQRVWGDLHNQIDIGELLAENIHHPDFMYWTRAHGVFGILYQRVSQENPGLLENWPLSMVAAGKSLEFHQEKAISQLEIISKCFSEAHLSWASWKGPLLGKMLSPKGLLRSFDDLDILVHSSDLLRVANLLKQLGYHPQKLWNAGQYHWLLKAECEETWELNQVSLPLEVHWNVLPRYFPQSIALGELDCTCLPGYTLPIPTPEWAWIMGTLHSGPKHFFDSLGQLGEMYRLSQLPHFDWDKVLRIVHQKKMKVIAQQCIQIQDYWWGIDSTVKSSLKTYHPISISFWKAHWFDKHLPAWSKTQVVKFHLIQMEDFSCKFKYLFKKFMLPNFYDLQWVVLPKKWSFLYPCIRWLRLAVSVFSKS